MKLTGVFVAHLLATWVVATPIASSPGSINVHVSYNAASMSIKVDDGDDDGGPPPLCLIICAPESIQCPTGWVSQSTSYAMKR